MTLRMGYEIRSRTADLIFDVVDTYALSRAMGEPDPRPMEPLYFYATARLVNGVELPIDPPQELVMTKTPSGNHVFFGTVKMPDNAIRQHVLAPGQYIVLIDTRPYNRAEAARGVPRLYQPREVTVELPMPDPRSPGSNTPYRVELLPAPVYPFPHAQSLRRDLNLIDSCSNANIPVSHGPTLLSGSLHQRDGRPWAGVGVAIPAIAAVHPCTTGPDGGWVLAFPEDQATGTVSVNFGFPQPDNTVVNVPVQGVCVVHGYECNLAQASLRGRAIDRGQPITRFTLQIASTRARGPYPDLAVTSADGSWFYYLDLNQPRDALDPNQPGVGDFVNVTALLPDGRSLVAQNVPVHRRAAVVVPAFQFQ